MKIKFSILLLLLCAMSITVVAQNNEKKTNNRITSKVYLENLVNNESSSEYVITAGHISSTSGIKHTYVRQAIDGIEVLGTESSIHTDTSGKVIAAHVNFVDAINNTLKNKSASLTAEQAIQSVAQQMGYQISNLEQIETARGINQKALFNKAGISNTDIPVKLMYYFQEGKGTTLIWELSVEEKDSADWWNFRVDASTGKIIDKENFTLSCLEGIEHDHDHTGEVCDEQIQKEEKLFYTVANAPSAMVGSYNVVAMPDESPQHGSLGRAVVANPDNAIASPFGWHDTDGIAGAESEYTVGNNTDAYDDRTSTVTGTGSGVDSERAFGGPSLTFSDPFNTNVTAAGTDNSIDAAVTNLFYWANIIHDVLYQYGFDEASGNFQENNYGNGGIGGDSVRSEAQDGSGTCNANFSTPADGGKGRMQMYVCGTRDGDFDNGVVVHEYGHGISTRLTGGAGTSCLNNQEQMGEGWSDYYGLVLTMEAGDAGTDPRGIGTWLLGQSASGAGIRDQRYDTDTNTYSYDTIKTAAVPHGVGSVWAMMLWEMTWELIAIHGWDADIYNGTGGNNIALNLVTEGLKLQGCSPGFIDGRDAILAADLAIYGGANECAIWTAFAKRGLGFSADQGASSSRADGTEAYDLPVATLLLSSSSFCDSEGTINGLSGGRLIGGVYSGTGVTDDGNGMTFTFDATVAGVGAHTITYTDSCRAVPTQATDTITVTDGTLAVICQDTTVTLDAGGNATIANSDVVANTLPDTTQYTIDQTGTFNVIDISATAIGVSLIEDGPSGALPLGFNFSFFGNDFTSFYLQSNGFLSFDNSGTTGTASWTPIAIPNTGGPNNMISFLWDDMSPQETPGVVRYATIGSAPSRTLVVDFINVRQYTGGGTGAQVTTQLQLFEGSNIIEVHTTTSPSGTTKTQGIENASGTAGFAVSGRNGVDFGLTNDVVKFIPVASQNLADNCGFSVALSLSKSTFTCRDIGTNTVTITADDGNGGVATCDATVTVVGETTTYTGSWDNGVPDAGKKALFNANYNTSTADIDACSCEVANNAIVTVAAGDYMNIDGNITVGTGSSLIVEHTGSIVQVDDAAIVTNNGTINVNLTTPTLNARDFLIMGSPMTAEDDAMFSAYQVLNHTTSNFTPYVGTPPVVGVNFHDQESNDWSNYTGTLTPGEGYFVRPSYTTGTTYNYVYNDGTLNNGVITYSAFFGDDKEDSPNVMSNPYPSAIDADLLISSNAIIDELYFWEHNTTPAVGVPGPLSQNFNMEDISTRNFLMGVAAATGGGIPSNIISTGQGFGIKANAAGDVTFNNVLRLTSGNTTIRQTLDKDLLWIEVRENTYGLGSTAGIGFTEGATPGLDSGYDTMKLGTVVSLYSHLEDGSEQLGIQGREAFDSSITIPMGFSTLIEADAGIPYVINISNLEGANIEQATVYLIDHLTNTITNLSTDRYEFLSDAGTFDNRFTLQFENLVLGTNDTVLESVSVYPNPAENILNIVSPKAVVTAVAVYDVRGRVVSERRFTSEGNNYQVDLSGLETALYFVKITTESGTITKRVVKQ